MVLIRASEAFWVVFPKQVEAFNYADAQNQPDTLTHVAATPTEENYKHAKDTRTDPEMKSAAQHSSSNTTTAIKSAAQHSSSNATTTNHNSNAKQVFAVEYAKGNCVTFDI